MACTQIKSAEISHSESIPRTRLQCCWRVFALASPSGYSPTVLTRSLATAALRPPEAWRRVLDEESRRDAGAFRKPAPAQSYFPACTSDTCRNPIYSPECQGQTWSSFTLHSFGRPLIDREKRDRILAALQQWSFSRCYNYSHQSTRRRSAQSRLHPTRRTGIYILLCEEKIILHWAQGAIKTEGNDFCGTSHSYIKMWKKERESACGLYRWTDSSEMNTKEVLESSLSNPWCQLNFSSTLLYRHDKTGRVEKDKPCTTFVKSLYI